MKRDFLIAYHQIRMNYYRKKAFSFLSKSGLIHNSLYQINPNYRAISDKYNESKKALVEMGEYILPIREKKACQQ